MPVSTKPANLGALLLLLFALVRACCAQPTRVTSLAGYGYGSGMGSSNGVGTAASFSSPYGIALGPGGVAFVADAANNMIRRVDTIGNTTTFAGRSAAGSTDGVGSTAQFSGPSGIAVDASGTVYVCDTSNHVIRVVLPNGTVTKLAGNTSGFLDGQGPSARFNGPKGAAVDAQGNLYVADTLNHAIRVVSPNGTVVTLAGDGSTQALTNGVGTSAKFKAPTGVAVDAQGNVHVADAGNFAIRLISPNGSVTTIAGNGVAGYVDSVGAAAQFQNPTGVAVDAAGLIYTSPTEAATQFA